MRHETDMSGPIVKVFFAFTSLHVLIV